ncbi:MAG: outer membrane beta-barrel protein [Calditrichia bacterium]
MKKTSIVLLLLLAFSISGFARAPFTEFKVGYLNPKAAEGGYIFGFNVGRMIDESLSWSLELNYFQKGYRKQTTIDRSQTGNNETIETVQLEMDFKTRIVPVFVKLNYEHPLGYRSPLYARASAGLGWELLWNSEDNYVDKIHQTRFFNGFGWQLSGGVGFEISSSANFFADIFYNDAIVKRNQTKNELGLPTWDQLNISGLGVRLGVSIVGFGW